MKFKFNKTNLITLLEEYPELKEKDNRMKAVWTYYEVFEGITDAISKEEWLSLTNVGTILRNIRKIVNPELDKKNQITFGMLDKKN